MKIYIPLLLLIILTISFSSCSKKTESTTSTSAERLDLNEEQAARVQPVTAGLYGERKDLRNLRDDVQDEILVQLKSDTSDAPKLESVRRSGCFVIDERIPIVAQVFAEGQAVLIPEQRAEFVEKI